VTCAVYAHKHGLLEEEGWKWFKRIAKREKKMLCMVNIRDSIPGIKMTLFKS
jgi:hypothetical protein